jgi:hypothetical protein
VKFNPQNTGASTRLILLPHKAHTAADRICYRDKEKILKFQEQSMIAHAVKVALLQTSAQLLLNFQDFPTQAIDCKYKKSED